MHWKHRTVQNTVQKNVHTQIISFLLSLFQVPYKNVKLVQLLQAISNHHLFVSYPYKITLFH